MFCTSYSNYILLLTILLSLVLSINGFFDADEAKNALYNLKVTDEVPLDNDDHTFVDDNNKDDDTLSKFVLSSQYGQQFVCNLPKTVIRTENDEQNAQNLTLENVTTVLNSSFKSRKCLRKLVGWWTYEFCMDDIIKQYHAQGKEIVGEELNLGVFSSTNDLPELNSKTTPYHSQWYSDGTLCDLSSRLRRTEVRFYCDEDLSGTDAYIARVDEPKTCEYLFTIHVASLCQLKAFLPKDRPPTPQTLICHPHLTTDQLKRYKVAKKEQMAAKITNIPAQNKVINVEEIKARRLKSLKPADKFVAENDKKTEQMMKKVTDVMEQMMQKQVKKMGGDPQSVQVVDFTLNLFGDENEQKLQLTHGKGIDFETTKQKENLKEFIEVFLAPDYPLLEYKLYYINSVKEWERDVKALMLHLPYYRNALRQVKENIEKTLAEAKNRPLPETPDKPASLGKSKRQKKLESWFRDTLKHDDILEKVKDCDLQLRTIKEEAYIQYISDDKVSYVDQTPPDESLWQSSVEEEEEHKFYRFVGKLFLLDDFVNDDLDLLDQDLEVLDILFRPARRNQLRRFIRRVEKTLAEAKDRTGRPSPEEASQPVKGDRFSEYKYRKLFGSAMDYADIYEKAREFDRYAKSMYEEARVIYEAEAHRAEWSSRPPRPIKKSKLSVEQLSKFARLWFVDPLVHDEVASTEKIVAIAASPKYHPRLRFVKQILDDVYSHAVSYNKVHYLNVKIDPKRKEEVRRFHLRLPQLLGNALQENEFYEDILYIGPFINDIFEDLIRDALFDVKDQDRDNDGPMTEDQGLNYFVDRNLFGYFRDKPPALFDVKQLKLDTEIRSLFSSTLRARTLKLKSAIVSLVIDSSELAKGESETLKHISDETLIELDFKGMWKRLFGGVPFHPDILPKMLEFDKELMRLLEEAIGQAKRNIRIGKLWENIGREVKDLRTELLKPTESASESELELSYFFNFMRKHLFGPTSNADFGRRAETNALKSYILKSSFKNRLISIKDKIDLLYANAVEQGVAVHALVDEEEKPKKWGQLSEIDVNRLFAHIGTHWKMGLEMVERDFIKLLNDANNEYVKTTTQSSRSGTESKDKSMKSFLEDEITDQSSSEEDQAKKLDEFIEKFSVNRRFKLDSGEFVTLKELGLIEELSEIVQKVPLRDRAESIKLVYDKTLLESHARQVVLAENQMKKDDKTLTSAEWAILFEKAMSDPDLVKEFEALDLLMDSLFTDALKIYYKGKNEIEDKKKTNDVDDFPDEEMIKMMSKTPLKHKVDKLRNELREIYGEAYLDYLEQTESDEEETVQSLTAEYTKIQSFANKLLSKATFDYLGMKSDEPDISVDNDFLVQVFQPKIRNRIKELGVKMAKLYEQGYNIYSEEKVKSDIEPQMESNKKMNTRDELRGPGQKAPQFNKLLKEAIGEAEEELKNTGELEKSSKSTEEIYKSLADTVNMLTKQLDKMNDKDNSDKDTQIEDDEEGQDGKVKVRVSKVESSHRLRREVSAETQKLEEQLESQLKEAGFDPKGHKVQVKVVTGGYYGGGDDQNAQFHILGERESKHISDLIVSMLGGDSMEKREETRHQNEQSVYSFQINHLPSDNADISEEPTGVGENQEN